MIYKEESITLLKHLGLYGQRPEAYVRLMNHVITVLSRKNGHGEVPLPYNNSFGENGKRIHPSNFLNDLEGLPEHLQLLTVTRQSGRQYYHDGSTLIVDDDIDWNTFDQGYREMNEGFRKAHSVSLNPDKVFEFMAVTNLNSDTLKLSDDTEFLRSYYSSIRIHRSDNKSFVKITNDTPSHLIKLLPHTHDFMRRDVIDKDDDGNPIGPFAIRIYGGPWQNLPKNDRKNWTILNWRNRGVYHAKDLMDLDINSCALAVVSNHFGYDAHKMVAKLNRSLFDTNQFPIKGFSRTEIKFMVNSIIHGGFRVPATSALEGKKLPVGFSNNKEVVDALCDYLPPLRNVIDYHERHLVERIGETGRKYSVVSSDARKHFMLMYQSVESEWAMKMLHFAHDNKLSVLTFHDGFTVPKEQLPIFKAYSDVVLPKYLSTSIDPFIESDGRDSDLIPTEDDF